MDRFRSLPIWRPAPLVGAVLGDSVRYVVASVIVVVLGLVMGFDADGGVGGIVAAIALVVFFSFCLSWTFTTLGLVMRATQYDRETAQAFGIPVDRVYALVFALGAMLAAVAAVLIVPISQAHYLMGLDPLLLSFIVVIIGGLGSIKGTVVAALVIGMSDGIISVFFSPTLAKILATLLVALVLVFRPNGLFGTQEIRQGSR